MARVRLRRHRRALVVAVLATAAALVGLPAEAITPDPAPWPADSNVDPGIDAAAHGLRIAGPDRTQTSLSTALILRGTGGYPFSTADRTAGSNGGLSDASSWWGLAVCPFSVIITAGDTAADSLAAASLSDPTDGSSEPRLVRSAAADSSFDPIGGTARVDTEAAPILVTASARQGAKRLSPATRVAAADLANGGCRTARSAIVVGGSGAVPAEVDAELIGLGYNQVFRVAGESRYGTAAAIAEALGTGDDETGTVCADPVVSDGDTRLGFHGNAAVEYRTSTTDCEVLGRTVALADGITGADALAAGWWTSTWQVPVLLTDGDGVLPPATREALAKLEIDNIVVLGGSGRIPDTTVAEAGRLASAATVRVAGEDRYGTSVHMARTFGGWFPTGDGHDYAGSSVCLAASSGTGSNSTGWPDALGAGPWCAAGSVGAGGNIAPRRALSPTNGARPRTTAGAPAAHDAVPVLLTPAGAAELAPSVADLLAETFSPSTLWCTSTAETVNSCADPGFVHAFGGTVLISDDVFHQAVRAVSGQTYVVDHDRRPGLADAFFTRLDLSPVFAAGAAPADVAAGFLCLPRNGANAVRWLTAYDSVGGIGFDRQYDVMLSRLYRRDVDGVGRQRGALAPVCMGFAGDEDDTSSLFGVSLSGEFTQPQQFDYGPQRRLTLDQRLSQTGPVLGSGADTTTDEPGEMTALSFTSGDSAATVTSQEQPAAVTSWGIDIVLQRGANVSEPVEPDTFTAQLTLETELGTVTAQASGEAIFDGTQWQLRGRTVYTGGTWNVASGSGGFVADVVAGQEGFADDALTWTIDGLTAEG